MKGGLNRWLVCMLVAGTAVSMQACGDDGGDDNGGTTPDVTDDTTPDTTPGGDTDAGPTPDGSTCEDPCTRARDCEALGDNFICESGCCVEDDTPVPCTRVGQECSEDGQSTDSFLCDTGLGQCLQRCADALTESSEGGNCPPRSNTFCFALNDPEPPIDPNTGDVLDGVCVPGDCSSQFGEDGAPDTTVCSGVTPLGETVACGDDDCTCNPVGNGASFCVTAGPGEVGDACLLESDADGNLTGADQCAGGLTCFRNVCVQACNAGADTSCTTEEETQFCLEGGTCECQEVLDTSGDNEPGICAQACEPFSANECPTGATCTPSWGRFGLNDWLCTPNAATPIPAGGECDLDLGNFGQCAEGSICVAEAEGSPGVCTSLCDPRNPNSGALAACGGAAAGPEVVGDTAFGEASDYLTLAEGAYSYELRSADGALLAPVAFTSTDGTASTAIAAIDDDGDLTIITVADVTATDTLPSTGLRGVHAAGGVGEVDVYLGVGLSDVDYGAAALLNIAPGDSFGYIYAGDTTLGPIDIAGVPGGTVVTAVALIVDGAPTVELVGPVAQTVAAGTSYIRPFHGAFGAPNVDIYVDCEGGAAGCTTAAVEDLAYGDVSSLAGWVALPAGAHSVYVFAAGDVPADDAPVATLTATLATGTFYTISAFNVGGDVELVPFAHPNTVDADSAAAVAIHAAPAAGIVDIAVESATPVREGLSFAGVLGSADSAYVELAAGSYSLAIRAAGADPDSEPAIATGVFAVEADTLYTAVAAGTATSGLEAILVTDSLPELGTDEGALRLLHAAKGGPVVTLNEVGEAENACAPISIAGLGFCQEICEPFPRRPEGSYPGCDAAGDSCLPFYQRDDRAVEAIGQCSTPAAEDVASAGETCGNPGFLGGGCADFAVCLSETEEDTEGTCSPLCDGFGEGTQVCGDGQSCNGVPLLLGNAFGFCVETDQPGNVGDRCTESGTICGEDNTLCIEIAQGTAECLGICREGFPGDCTAGTSCRTGVFGSQVPDFMGVCLEN
jgi:hypothetical protein